MNRWLVVVGVALTSLAAGPSPSAADSAPAWVVEASRIPTPSDVGDAPAVDLWRDCSITMKPDGRLLTVSRRVVRVLLVEGRAWASEREAYVAGAATVDLKAWAIRPSGTVKAYGAKQTVDRSLVDYEVYSEDRERKLDLESEAEVGTVFGFESTVDEQVFALQVGPYFQNDLPAVSSVVRIAVPPRWEVRAFIPGHGPVEPVRLADGAQSWTLKGLPRTRSEPLGPVWYTRVPRLAANLVPPGGVPPQLSGGGTWSDVGRWVSGIAEPQSALTDRLTEKAKALTAGVEDEWGRIERISEFVQGVRYAAIQTGIARGEGYKPHAASEVLAKSYGDCKDKANLELTMLKAIGIRSYLAPIYSGDRDFVRADWPAPTQFNHCIVAIAVGDRVESPLIVDVPGLGRLLPFDPTDPTTPLGDLPLEEQGSHALIAAASGSALVKMPLLPAAANSVRRQAVGKLALDGHLDVEITMIATGQSASSYRSVHRYRDAARYRSAMEAWLAEKLPGASLTRFAVRDTTKPNEFRVEAELLVPHAARALSGGTLAFQPAFLPSHIPWFTDERPRQTPVRMDPASLTDVIEVRVPEGYVVESAPDSVQKVTSYGMLRARCDATEAQVRYTQEVRLDGGLVPPEQAGQLLEFLAQARGAGRGYIVIAPRSSATRP